MEVSNASYRMPKEIFNAWLKELLDVVRATTHRA